MQAVLRGQSAAGGGAVRLQYAAVFRDSIRQSNWRSARAILLTVLSAADNVAQRYLHDIATARREENLSMGERLHENPQIDFHVYFAP